MTMTPNYGALLQSFWTPPTASTEEHSNSADNNLSEPTDIIEFLGEDLFWRQTIPAKEPDLRDIPDDLPLELIEALHVQGIYQFYSHQLKALQTIRSGKSLILTSPTASGKKLSTYPGILEGCMSEEHRALAFYGLRALALDQFHKISALLAAMPATSSPVLAMMTGDVKTDEREQVLASNPHILGVTPDLIHFQLKQAWKSERWAIFYQRLRYVLIDEAHTFSGSYGANMAWLVRRLRLAVDHYGGCSRDLQFIFLSATCGNPKQLARKLSGLKPTKRNPKPLVWIYKSGAAVPDRQVVITQPSYNLTADTARVIQFLLAQGKSGIAFCNSRRSVRDLAGLLKSPQVAAFYGGISPERRAEVIQQLQSGVIKWIVATEALEAGIDLPELECCVLRGWPGSKMAYQQRSGRAGRSGTGLTVLIPNALNPIDRYIIEHPEVLISGEAEEIFFNDEYPIFAAKHLLCAAAETGIPTSKIKHYFGSSVIEVVKLLMAQGHLNKGRNGLWARGYPHRDINFRGGVSQTTIKLVDAESGEEMEEVSEDIAYREVYPQAIYKRQDGDGRMLTYQCITLDLRSKRAILKPIAESPLFTVAVTQSETISLRALTDPMLLPLKFSEEVESSANRAYLTIELSYGQVSHITSSYSVLTQSYEQTCLDRRCLNYKEPLPQERRCPFCSKLTRKALIVKTLSEESFERPYRTQCSAPIVKVAIDSTARDCLQAIARAARTSLSRSGQPIPPGHQQLWEHSSTLIAIHSFGHQILRSLQLFARVDPREVNFSVVKEPGNSNNYAGYFYDTSDGGNGASEAVFKHMVELASAAAVIARGCDCDAGCAKCLIQHGCPDGNTALLKQMGLVLLDALASPSIQTK